MKVMKKSLKTKKKSLLELKDKYKVFTLSDAKKLGFSHTNILNLYKQKEIIRIQRGLYSFAGLEPIGAEADYEIACKKFGDKSVIGGLTALSNYRLIDEVPSKIWVVVPINIRTTDRRYKLLRTNKNLSFGIIDNGSYRISSLERALVDGLRYQSKIGERIVKLAILRALQSKKTTADKLFSMAKKLEALSLLEKHWESITIGLL